MLPLPLRLPLRLRLRRPVRALVLAGLLLSAAACGDVSREGTYRGPSEAMVKVSNDAVVELKLVYGGNSGFMFASGRVGWEGSAGIVDDGFTVRTQAAVITGRFVDGNRKIEGSWQDGEVTGTWRASKD